MKRISFAICLFWMSSFSLGATERLSTAQQSCERKCRMIAQQLYRECRHNGGTQEQCRTAAHESLARCIEETCNAAPTCEIRCQHNAVHEFNTCIEAHEPVETCAARARAALIQCLTEHCNVPTGCKERCAYLGQALGRLCLAEGGSPEQCRQRVHAFIEHCIQEGCPPCGGIGGVACPKGEFCLFAPGTCEVADNQGVCAPVPEACPMVYHPVCGCDGETYGNACEAAMAGVSIDHPGPCHEVCGGIAGVACPEGQFCQFPPGECHIADNEGRCRPIPTACPDIHEPVCGCDGTTYGNACEAAAAGVAIDHAGPCAD